MNQSNIEQSLTEEMIFVFFFSFDQIENRKAKKHLTSNIYFRFFLCAYTNIYCFELLQITVNCLRLKGKNVLINIKSDNLTHQNNYLKCLSNDRK